MGTLILFNLLTFLILGITWSKKDLGNLVIKLGLLFMGAWNLLQWLRIEGYLN